MSEEFPVGTRVRYSDYARETLRKARRSRATRLGTVVGCSRSEGCVRVHWDGLAATSLCSIDTRLLEKG